MSGADRELEVAHHLSASILAAAECGDMFAVGLLDDQRRELLESFRRRVRHVQPGEQRFLDDIAALNDRTLGTIEHQRRVKARQLEMVAVGRRAVSAYASTSNR